jgi:magnesium transporter
MLRLVEQDLNSLSVEIFAEQHSHRKQVKKLGLKRMVQRLGKKNSSIACLRESSASLAALTSYFLEHGKGQLQPGVSARLKTLEQDIGSLRQYDAELSSEVGFLLDSTVGLINFEQNQSMKMLSVAAAIYFSAPALFSVAMTTLGTIFCYWRASGLLRESSPEFDIVPESTN